MELIVFIALIPFTKTPQNLNHSKFIYFRLALTVDFSRTTQSRLIDIASFTNNNTCHLFRAFFRRFKARAVYYYRCEQEIVTIMSRPTGSATRPSRAEPISTLIVIFPQTACQVVALVNEAM